MADSPAYLFRSRDAGLHRSLAAALLFELLALGLLKAGLRAEPSLAFACGATALFLSWRSVLHFARSAWRGITRAVAAILRRACDRRTYRFQLSTLLLAITIIATVCAWYSYRLHKVQLEQKRLAGKWQMFNTRGEPLVLNGKQLIEDFEQGIRDGTCTIDPARDPKWIDFHSSTGVSRGIYRWEGKRLRIAQASENSLRPTFFDPRHVPDADPNYPRTPGVVSTHSCSHWICELIADQ